MVDLARSFASPLLERLCCVPYCYQDSTIPWTTQRPITQFWHSSLPISTCNSYILAASPIRARIARDGARLALDAYMDRDNRRIDRVVARKLYTHPARLLSERQLPHPILLGNKRASRVDLSGS